MTEDLFAGLPERPRDRIDLLLGLIAADWKRTGSDQRFFQYVTNLQRRLNVGDGYMVEDYDLIAALSDAELPKPSRSDFDPAAGTSSADPDRREETTRRQRRRTPVQQAAAEKRVKIEAARLRCELDKRLGRETPQWVIELAKERPGRP
ncbi:hypothetical protein [Arthrobacter sp. VKM Ac-2550]|uniref:hypothetical protein n=1 Tax=Crystallibacter permensis TaxID=1938888 RepID=UPI002226D872|nr:hypothetical protein [Arthrobacter sp. VKM Ac-2550]MCW2132708.1 hypothetical protein [Arthrobacter sp. VKM Ac-2550]